MTERDFAAAGLYDPQAPNAAERLELLEWLAEQGVTLEEMQAASGRGALQAIAADRLLQRGRRYTLPEAAARAGMAPELVRSLRLAVGLPVSHDERVFSDDDVELLSFFRTGAGIFGEEPLLRLQRTIGSALARMAEAAISLFYTSVEGPMRTRGTSERALAEAGLRATESVEGLQRMLQTLFRAHMADAIQRFRSLQLGRLVHSAHMTVGFIDLVGFTPIASRLSAAELAALVERFEVTAYDVVTARGGRVVKLIGDEVMFVTGDAAAACDAGLALVEHFAEDASVTPRGALATGDLIVRGGDYYGPIVNLAARAAGLAVPRELLVTAAVAAEAEVPSLQFERAGRRMLKGFDEPVPLLTVGRA